METQTLEFYTVAEIRRAFDHQGSYWFSPDTMRAFGTSFPNGGKVFAGRFFVTKERSRGHFSNELYMVREVERRNIGDTEGAGTYLEIRTHHVDDGYGHGGFRTYEDARDYILYTLI